MSRARNLAGFASAIENPSLGIDIDVGIVSASKYYGDGSNLTGTPGGLGTALALPLDDPLNKIYYTNRNLSIGNTITINVPDTADVAYTQYANIVLVNDADLIVSDGDDFIPDILGIGSDVDAPGILQAGKGKLRVDNITSKDGFSAPSVPYGLVVPVGAALSVGLSTVGSPSIVGVGSTSGIFFPESGKLALVADSRQVLVVDHRGNIGIGTTIPDNKPLHVYDDSINPLIVMESGDTFADLIQTDTQGSTRLRSTAGEYRFYTNGDAGDTSASNSSERVRILSTGELLVARTAGIGSTTQNIQVGQQILAPEGLIGDNGGWSRVPDRLVTRAGGNINDFTYKVDLTDLTKGVGTNGSLTLFVTFTMRRSNTTAAYNQKSQYMGLWHITRQSTNLAHVDATHLVTNNITVDSIAANNPGGLLDVTLTFDTPNVRAWTDHAAHFCTSLTSIYPGTTA
jgi:hypothetical protein